MAGDEQVPRLERRREKGKTFHGPVQQETDEAGRLVYLTLTGGEESDVLHAAGAWIAEHLYAVIIAVNWYGDISEDAADAVPQHKMRLIVDMSLYGPRP